MTSRQDLLNASRSELRNQITHGYSVDPESIEGWAYRGISLGLPKFVEKFTWKTFQKTFWRDPVTGALRGWNVRLEQKGIDAASTPILKNGKPLTVWHYSVIDPVGVPAPKDFNKGLIIDYSLGPNPKLDPISLNKDPLVAVEPGNNDLLLGVTYMVLGGVCIETPTYFLLQRENRITFVPDEYSGQRVSHDDSSDSPPKSSTRLRGIERRWGESLFEAILPGSQNFVPLATLNKDRFWQCLEQAPADSFGLGLRAMVYTLNFMPLAEYGRPFYSLSDSQKENFLLKLSEDERYPVRQMLVTMKTLACFAYFDQDEIRNHFTHQPSSSRGLP